MDRSKRRIIELKDLYKSITYAAFISFCLNRAQDNDIDQG
jgi:hypothetical protein